MAQKLWEKSVQVNKDIERFTVGRDREMDLYLAKHDVLGSMAHITMLESIGLLTKEELRQLLAELKEIYAMAERGEFVIEEGVEDVHSQVELMLTRNLGDIGKKIQRTFAQRPGVARFEALYPCRDKGSGRGCGTIVPCAGYAERTLQGCTDAGLYTLADSHAVFFRTLVWGIRREPGGRYDVPSGSFQDVQPQSFGFCCGIRFLVPAEPYDDYPSFGI